MTTADDRPDDVEQRLSDWGHGLALSESRPLPPAIQRAVERHAPARLSRAALWRFGSGLALAASLVIVAIIALRTGPATPAPSPTPIAAAKPDATSQFSMLALARANRGADPDHLVLPDLPNAPASDTMRLGPGPAGG